jgi:predicted transcriptional regulator
MAVISLRLNRDEEKMVNLLSSFYEQDKSTLIKHSLNDMYEDLIDRKVIEEYETKEKENKAAFVTSEEIIKKTSKNFSF